MFKRDFKRKINVAIGWGAPCRESVGYSHRELTTLLSECLERINYLEQTLKASNIAFTETDWTSSQEQLKDI